eukprot:TRINITY_DN12447_c0_g1_i1.p1 TRINITY_DN12447_c0_g1~~TRINITY_DN12447_c0_g1_i1.p1  ORF type:complete len:110 (-),score=15.05 TRINITY_DN12447_c0_g1_i1:53-337(-)
MACNVKAEIDDQNKVVACGSCYDAKNCYHCSGTFTDGSFFVGRTCKDHKPKAQKCPKCGKGRSSMSSRQYVKFCKPCNNKASNQYSHRCCGNAI